MDNKKKEKLVAIIVTTLISLAVSVIGCLLGISPDSLSPCLNDAGVAANNAIVYNVDIP